ncbi:MAG: hypothetical protein BWY86_00419 [Candidatus Aminicenantes bacterium ADurb.Bin508]|nr:MAG: hypothetical protein BWY86_00419 [Candidatus Aminicenantes bacterium ADurb.Bin508]
MSPPRPGGDLSCLRPRRRPGGVQPPQGRRGRPAAPRYGHLLRRRLLLPDLLGGHHGQPLARGNPLRGPPSHGEGGTAPAGGPALPRRAHAGASRLLGRGVLGALPQASLQPLRVHAQCPGVLRPMVQQRLSPEGTLLGRPLREQPAAGRAIDALRHGLRRPELGPERPLRSSPGPSLLLALPSRGGAGRLARASGDASGGEP